MNIYHTAHGEKSNVICWGKYVMMSLGKKWVYWIKSYSPRMLLTLYIWNCHIINRAGSWIFWQLIVICACNGRKSRFFMIWGSCQFTLEHIHRIWHCCSICCTFLHTQEINLNTLHKLPIEHVSTSAESINYKPLPSFNKSNACKGVDCQHCNRN